MDVPKNYDHLGVENDVQGLCFSRGEAGEDRKRARETAQRRVETSRRVEPSKPVSI